MRSSPSTRSTTRGGRPRAAARAEDRRHARRRRRGRQGDAAADRRRRRVPDRHGRRRHPRRRPGRVHRRDPDLDRPRHRADARREHGRLRVPVRDERQHPGCGRRGIRVEAGLHDGVRRSARTRSRTRRTSRSTSPRRSRTAAARSSGRTSTRSARATTPRSSRRSRASARRRTSSSRRCSSPTASCSCASSGRPGSTMPVLSTDGNADPALLDAGKKAIDGLTFTNSVCTAEGDPAVQQFYDDYNARYGKDPASYVAVIGYDEVNLVAKRDHRGGQHRSGRRLKDKLANMDYTGISGHVQMDPKTRRANKPASLAADARHEVRLPRGPAASRASSRRRVRERRLRTGATGARRTPRRRRRCSTVEGLTVVLRRRGRAPRRLAPGRAGEIVAALGPNGAGKTTLLRDARRRAEASDPVRCAFDGSSIARHGARRRSSGGGSRSSRRAVTCSPSSRSRRT